MSSILDHLQAGTGRHAAASVSTLGLNVTTAYAAWPTHPAANVWAARDGVFPGLVDLSLTGWAGVFLIAYLAYYNLAQLMPPKDAPTPPLVYHCFPVLGSALSYGRNPYAFFEENRRKHGNVFTFVLLGRRVTTALGPTGCNLVLQAKLSEMSAAEAYYRLTTPIFGKEVIYDVPDHVFMQQKKFVKGGLTTDNFKRYVPVIVGEVKARLEETYKNGTGGRAGRADAFKFAATITICTSAATLQGKEVRQALDTSMMNEVHNLNAGLHPANYFVSGLPLPRNWRRDKAQKALSKFYRGIIAARRAALEAGETPSPEQESDMMSALQGQVYKDGRTLSDLEVAHLMITLLIAGQHTSAVAISWCLLRLAERPDLVERLRKEQEAVYGRDEKGDLQPLTYEQIGQSPLLTAFIKETLRLHPTSHSTLRIVKSPIVVPTDLSSPAKGKAYVIPPGHYALTSPGLTQMDPSLWQDASSFDPYRWLDGGDKVTKTDDDSEQVDYGFGLVKSGVDSAYLPFGAGRHRCAGEAFVYVQLGAVLATVLRECDIEPMQPLPPSDFSNAIVQPKSPRDLVLTPRVPRSS